MGPYILLTSVWRGQAQEPQEALCWCFLNYFCFPNTCLCHCLGFLCPDHLSILKVHLWAEITVRHRSLGSESHQSVSLYPHTSQWSFEFRQVFIKNLHFETGLPLEEAHTHWAVGQTEWLTQGSSWMESLGNWRIPEDRSWRIPEDRVSSSECDRRGPVNEANGIERHFSLRMSVHMVQNFTDVVNDQGYLMIDCIRSFIMINWM